MSEKEKLLKNVRMYKFAMIEAGMFLDTHPNDKEALEYFRKNKALAEKATEEYEKRFGPLTLRGAGEKERSWDWVKGPWPWEGEK
ncbi:MAG: spore coat protein CotJB [Clostridia bacterium]|nr:spore coat protein CotJB [Clostridia bacterium]